VLWQEVREKQARLAELDERVLGDPGVGLVVTIRQDGSPRLSPVEPLFWKEDLWVSMMLDSRKAQDLVRDERVLVHNIVTNKEGKPGEYKVRGRAKPENDAQLQSDYADVVNRTLGWSPQVGRFHLFRIDVEEITFIRYDIATGDQYFARWPRGGDFVRRATSATSVGAPEPYEELLSSEY
jgi:hypothetical protein